ncbi:MAG: Lipid A core--O-antigen ligase-like protein [Parcubacteria group bacterium Gr01-1014_17]|nr:MAG: Lipid A core--O-antigen ligase-like protein [Parcubacteria group bacterium Gr01-1014_17]
MTFNKALRWTVLGALIAAVFVPLFVSNSLFFPFISGKNFAFRILAEIAFAAWLILSFRNPEYRPRRSALLWSVLFFVVTLGVSTLLAEDPYKSFWSNFERMEGLIGVAHFALYFVVAGAMFRAKEWRTFVLASLCVNVLIIGYSLLQFFGVLNINQGGVRVDATFGNAIYLGVYALFHLFFALLTAYHARTAGKNAWWVGGFSAIALGNVVLVFLSATRGAILGLFVGFVAGSMLIAFSRGVSSRFRRVGMVGCVLALLAVGGFFTAREVSYLRNHPIFGRILSASPMNDDAQARFVIWQISWKGFTERPLFGWGQEGFNFVFNKHYDPRLYHREAWFDRAHNTYLDWMIAGGIFGIFGYLALWFFAARIILRAKAPRGRPLFDFAERALFAGFGTAYAVNNVFVFDNGTSYFLFFMLLAYVYSRATEGVAPLFHSRVFASKSAVARACAPAIIAVLSFSLYWFNARPAYAGTLLLQALHAHQGGPSENLALFRRALALNTFANAEIREQLAQVTAAVAPLSQVPVAVKQEFLNVAASEIDKEIKKRPADARYYTLLASLLDAFKLYKQAFPYWQTAIAQSPHKQALLFQIGGNRLNVGRAQEAVPYFKTAYELNMENREAAIIYAVGLIYNGNTAEVKKVLIPPLFPDPYVVDERIIRAYTEAGKDEELINTYRNLLKIEPNNGLAQIRYGGALFFAGYPEEMAIKEIQEGLKKSPQYAVDADSMIKIIQSSNGVLRRKR